MILALRSLVREKAWTAVALLTLALGIGANSALFTIVNAVLLRPLPYPESERVLSLSESDKGVDLGVVSSPTYAEWSRSARSLSALGAYSSTSAVLQVTDEPERVNGLRATAGYFSSLAVTPSRGRIISPADDRPGAPAVVLLSDQLWRRLLGADSALVSRTVVIDDRPYVTIGVMPPSFIGRRGPQYWLPMSIDPAPPTGTTFFYNVVGRLRPGVAIEAARAELTALVRRVDPDRPAEQRGRAPVVMTLHERRYGDTGPALRILLAAVGVLLLIACANVCNLLLARGARRQNEYAIRMSLGASGWQLMRRVLIECVVLSFAGGVLGLLVPIVALPWFVRIAPAVVAQAEGVHVDAKVLVFTLVVAVAPGFAFGLIPALQAARADEIRPRLESSRATASARRHRVGRGIGVFELAMALVLLTCAGLLTRSFARATAIDLGFRPQHVSVADFDLPSSRYSSEGAARFFTDVLERVRGFPEVESVALADVTPIGGARMSFATRDENGRETPVIDVIGVGAGFFATLGTPVLAGREFGPHDRAGAARVAIVNAALARLSYSSAGQAVGKQIVPPDGPHTAATIVGVVKDVRARDLEADARPGLFVPLDQAGFNTRAVLLARTREPLAFQRAAWQTIRSLDAALPAPEFTTMEQIVSDAVASRRFTFVLLSTFALLAATLAGVGLYGVMAYVVTDRTREMGVRLALGAEPREVVRLVVGQGMRLVFLGVVIGVAGSLPAVGLLRHMLFGVSIYDPWTFAAGAALVVVVGWIACWIPARRAGRTQPIVALRAE